MLSPVDVGDLWLQKLQGEPLHNLLYQSLVKMRPSHERKAPVDGIEKGRCSLTTYIHLASSFPMGSVFSALTGKSFSYLSAELYCDKKLVSTGVGGRLPTDQLPNFNNTKPIEKIKLLFGVFDWKNLSLFKKVRFQHLHPGRYLVKIYKENPLLGKERQFIGYKTVEVKDNAKTRIFCRSQGSAIVSVFDQNGEGVNDVTVSLIHDDTTISKNITDQDGKATVKARCEMWESSITLDLVSPNL